MSAERSAGHHCEAIFNHLIKVMVTKRGSPGEKANVTHVFKMGKKDDPGNFTSVLERGGCGKARVHLILEAISTHMMRRQESDQHGFTKWGKCLSNLI